MKILFISTMKGYPWGGSEELWAATALLATEAGHQVMVSVPEWPQLPARLNTLKKAGATITRHPAQTVSLVTRLQRKLKWGGSALPNTYQQVINFKPDVVCVSQGTSFEIVFDQQHHQVLEQLQVPYTIIVQHNAETGTMLDTAGREVARQLFNRAANVCFVSARNWKVAERQLAATLTNAKLIYNPVNLQQRQVLPWLKADVLKMACVARYDTAFKGQDILLETLSDKKWADRNYMLSLYGAGPDEAYLHELIQFYKLEQKVIIAGHSNDIETIWMNHHLLVLPSVSEGTPLSLIEANLCGRAAVGTDVGDMGTYISSGKTGFLAASASVAAVDATLELMWNSKHLLPEMGKAAYAFTSNHIPPHPAKDLLAMLAA